MSQLAADIPLVVVGCDFRVASSQARSHLVLPGEEALAVAQELKKGGWADGLAFLDTCNRNEWIACSAQPRWTAELLLSRLRQRVPAELRDEVQPFHLQGEDAARHLFRVSIGQESLVQGERQIATQFFRALDTARMRGTSNRILNGLGSIAGRLVRIAIRRGCVRSASIGIHSLSIAWLRRMLPRDRAQRVAIVGLGAIGRRVAGLLEEDEHFVPIYCSRHVPAGTPVRALDELPAVLAEADAAVICTAARQPVVQASSLVARPPGHPLLLVDIGIPQQVVAEGLPAGVQRIGLDDLVAFHTDPDDASCQVCGGGEADALVERAVDELRRFCNEPAFTSILGAVQRGQRELMARKLPMVLDQHLTGLCARERTELEQALKAALTDYTQDLLRTIRESSRQGMVRDPWSDEH